MKISKVTCIILAEREVAVFEHPTTGVQFPAGTIEPDESVLEAARREAFEEVGIKLSGGRVVGLQLGELNRAFVAWELEKRSAMPEYCETDGHRFRPFWLAQERVFEPIHPAQRAWWGFHQLSIRRRLNFPDWSHPESR